MKNRHLFYILFCMTSMFVISACEKSEIQKPLVKIEPRDHCIDDCNDCPVDDCCCALTALSGGQVTLTFCGVSDPCVSSTPCRASAGNCNISGSEFYGDINFGAGDINELFCVPRGRAFSIQPTSGSGTARLTCQLGQANPQIINITWNSPNKVYYTASDACFLTSCL